MRLAEALAQRDVLKLRYGTLKGAAGTASTPVSRFRYSRTEIKAVPTVAVAELQRQADRQAQELRELDVAIQEVNWTTDLAE